ncbi:MAG TPA: (5-formylfuran-3-yl)methyl phosphate synthase [Gammaproteobacteria bacterium]|nr:(5-formylfuran-3-yl)methyl phosphate synthase [Gammaproteobacteria bacterium]
MTALLASVRSLAEARLVAAGGADWIDLKEPAAGALGAVAPETVTAVARAYGATHRISATIGDCWDRPEVIPARVAMMSAAGAQYVKIGAYAADPAPDLLAALRAACALPARVILVCFAERAPQAMALEALAATGLAGVMLDTAVKDGPRLTELIAPDARAAFVRTARGLGLLSGLAGRLRADDVPALREAAPDYLGFRGALCSGGAREADIDPARVRALARRLARAAIPAEEDIHGLA